MPLPSLDAAQRTFEQRGRLGVDDALAVADGVSAQRRNLRAGGADLGQADDAGAAHIAALAMATLLDALADVLAECATISRGAD